MKLATKLLVLVFLFEFCAGLTQDLCEICKCHNNQVPKIVECEAKNHETLAVSGGKMLRMHRTKTIIFSNYKTLSFERNSFSQILSLELLEIRNTGLVVFTASSISNILNIKIVNVKNLSLIKRATIGLKLLQSIHLENVQMEKLSELALSSTNVTKDAVIRFENVTINEIETNAIDFEGIHTFELYNSNIESISKNGIDLMDAQNVLIYNSTFEFIDENGFSFDTKQFQMSNCQFNKLEQNFINLISGNISIHSNDFKKPSKSAFNGIKFKDVDAATAIPITSPKIEFYSNTIDNFALIEPLKYIFDLQYNISDNYINNCKCENDSQWLHVIQYHQKTMSKNFCAGVCEVTVFDFLKNMRNYCDKFRNLKTNALDVNRLCFNHTIEGFNLTNETSEYEYGTLLPTEDGDYPIMLGTINPVNGAFSTLLNFSYFLNVFLVLATKF